MRHRRLLAVLTVLPLAIASLATDHEDGCYVAVAGDPAITDDDVIACEAPTWIQDAAGNKAGNLAAVDQTDSPFPTFGPEEPTTSVTGGAGAGYLGTSLVQTLEPRPDATGFTIVGSFDGVVDSMVITLHGIHNGYGALPTRIDDPVEGLNPTRPTERNPMTAYVALEIDGIPVLNKQSKQVELLTAPAPTANAAEQYQVAITGLAGFFAAYDLALDGTHEIKLRVTPRYLNTDPVVLFLYGTSEVPSSIVFNQVEIPAELPLIELS